MVNVGDVVFERLQLENKTTKEYKGEVIFVHPENRFYRAEFPMECGIIRESFKVEPERKKKRR